MMNVASLWGCRRKRIFTALARNQGTDTERFITLELNKQTSGWGHKILSKYCYRNDVDCRMCDVN